jgi:hypothetical protein
LVAAREDLVRAIREVAGRQQGLTGLIGAQLDAREHLAALEAELRALLEARLAPAAAARPPRPTLTLRLERIEPEP